MTACITQSNIKKYSFVFNLEIGFNLDQTYGCIHWIHLINCYYSYFLYEKKKQNQFCSFESCSFKRIKSLEKKRILFFHLFCWLLNLN